MYRIMIVDDDRHIRERLKNGIDWARLDMEVCGEAADGDEALILYQQRSPNICILDIRIPNRDGLDLARQILASDPEVVVIHITGYNDFEYAQKALKLGAFDIIKKPLDLDEVAGSLKRAGAHIDALKRERQNSEKLKTLVRESLPVLKRMFLHDLVEGRITDPAIVRGSLDRYGIDLDNPYCVAAAIAPQLQDVPSEDIDITLVALQNISEELAGAAGFKCLFFPYSSYSGVILLSWSHPEELVKLDDVFTNIRNKFIFYFSIDMYIGIGSAVRALSLLHASFSDACEALDYKNVFARSNVVNIRNVIRILNRSSESFLTEIREIVSDLRAGDMPELTRKVNRLAGHVAAASMGKLSNLSRVFIELAVSILHVAADAGIDADRIVGFEEPYQTLLRMDGPREMVDWSLALCRTIMSEISVKKENRKSRIVLAAKEYINQHLSDTSLGLAEVSEHVELSCVYFSQFFHAETGIGINQYINHLRIEKAKGYLKNSMMKIYEISCAVGYSNPKYFNYIFKRIVGVTPKEYRLG